MVARTKSDESSLVTSMRDTLTRLDPKIVMIQTDTMASLIDGTLFPVRVAAMLVVASAASRCCSRRRATA